MKRAPVLVYGASGYTGRLTVQALLAGGVEVIVAGRDATKLEPLARSWGVRHRVFALGDPAAVRRGLAGARLLLSAAGPFEATTPSLVRACLEARVHYLDLGGEVRPLKLLADLDAAARARGVLLLPSVGFDVVPSDCLAAHVARALPGADELVLGVAGSDLLSRGSALTFAGHAGRPLYVVRDGVLEPLRFRTPLGHLDFGDGHRLCVATSWGDLVTAPRTTGIPNVTVCFEATAIRLGGIAANQQLGPLLASPLARRWYRSVARRVPEGPGPEVRARASATLYAEARRGSVRRRALLHTSEAYTFTALAAAEVVRRLLGRPIPSGFWTPAGLFGADFALDLGARREDLA